MPIPSRRWLRVAAALAALAPLGLVWPGTLGLLFAADLLWLGLLVADWLRAMPVSALDVEREPPAAFSVGRELPVRYRWRHGGRRVATVLVKETVPEPLGGPGGPLRVLRLPHGAVTEEVVRVLPVSRGVGEGGRLAVRIAGPWGLAWRQGALERPWRATVFPALGAVARRGTPLGAARRREAGRRAQRRPGEGRLFEGLREWVPGDDVRVIDWKATARRGKPIARQYEEERRQQVLLMLDAGRLLTAETEGVPRFEAAVQAALQLAHAAAAQDDDVGLLVFADTIQRFVPPARGRRALRAVLEGLAAAEARLVESDYPAAVRHLAVRSRKRALTVLFTDVIDPLASAALLRQTASLRPRHLPLAVTLRDPALERVAAAAVDSPAEAFERAAAEELLQARESALDAMRSAGVVVLDVPPARAGDAAVEGYRRLKRRGVL